MSNRKRANRPRPPRHWQSTREVACECRSAADGPASHAERAAAHDWRHLAAEPLLAALLAPLLWTVGRPDLFDSFSLGMIFVQMMVPELRTRAMQTQFANDLAKYNSSFEYWRQSSPMASRCDFTLLDRQGGLANDLAKKMIRERTSTYRGRLTPGGALRHPFFLIPVF